ncbi:MAG TPA: cysteine desulfurase family protein [Candidatus Sulfomarinibacteraceae bacterium]|nr:cysteine desulfurase family protein [Candidatus Sulfomarinibacteraceae bacterium]
MNPNGTIYMDHGASTPVDARVVEAMRPYWTETYGNPSSVHQFGRRARRALDSARQLIAGLLNATPGEIVFTGCGSESDNLALRGVMWAARAAGGGNHLLTTIVEHKAVLDTARQLRDLFDFELTILPVDEYGQVSVDDVAAAIRPETALISVMAANNEIGTLQPVSEIGALARERGILFHTDAIQAAAVEAWDVQNMPYDLISFAPHKFYGPKGVGILYVRDGVELVPALTGGSQEGARRAGTANVPYAVGAAEALRLAMEEREANISHYQKLRDRLIEGVLSAIPEGCVLTGHPEQRLPHNASFALRDLSGNDLLMHLDMAGIAASSGSACSTGNPKPSPILQAIGLDDAWTKGGLRLTVGRQNTDEDVDYVVQKLPEIVQTLRQLNVEYA